MSRIRKVGASRTRRMGAVAVVVSMAATGLNATSLPAVAASRSGSGVAAGSAGSVHGGSGLLTAAQAASRATATGKPVVASALTTAYTQVVAKPGGGYTLTQSAAPSRAWKNGAWAPLNAALARNADGSYSPTTSTSALHISGGGRGPLATLDTGGQVLSLTLPVALPKPAVSGDLATYANVIPGVDVTVTVADTGAFSDTFVVHNPAAAADPRLKSLLSSSVSLSAGLTQSTDSSGNITVADHGHTVFNAPAPYAWDSNPATTASRPARTSPTGAGVTGATGDGMFPATSGIAGPGRNAHVTRLGVTASAKALTLAEPTSLFAEPANLYPIIIDPWYTPSYGANGWASFGSSSQTSGTNRWDSTPDVDNDAFVGNTGVSSIGVVWSAFNFQIPDLGTSNASNLVGATVHSATFGITSNLSGSCPGQGYDDSVNLYAPSPAGGVYLQKSNATYDYWSRVSLGGATNSGQFGGSTSCGGTGAAGFSVTSAVQQEISTYHTGNQTFVLRANDETDVPATKRFPVTLTSSAGNPVLTIQYDKAPNPPGNLTLATGHGCGSTLGDSATGLEATPTSPMGGQLTTTFDLYTTSNSTNLLTSANGIASDSVTTTSGQSAVMNLSEAFLSKVSGGALTTFKWKAQDTDNTMPESAWSGECSFTFDPTRPGSPSITPTANASGVTCYTFENPGTGAAAPPVGTSCAFSLAKAPNSTISGYIYQVDQQQPVTVSATGTTTISFTLPQIVNTITVNALSAGGNIGQPALAHFDGSALNPPAPDGSVANDGQPDLIVAGGTGAFASGLWLTQTHADGTVALNPTNVGTKGLGYNDAPGTNPATDWNGAQVISGDFCGLGAQDVMAYFPGGSNAGGGAIDCSDGSADALTAGSPLVGGSSETISLGTFQDGAGNNASGVANAYNISGRTGTGAPDLFVTTPSGLYLFTTTTVNGYGNDFNSCGGSDVDCDWLSTQSSPDGTSWTNWTITTAETASGSVDMYLWNPTSGALMLWTGVTVSTASGAGTYPNATALSYTQYTIASNWETGGGLALRAGVTAGHTIPTLWATDLATGQISSVMPTTLPVTGSVPTAGATSVTNPTHAGQLQDMPAGTVTGTEIGTTADTVGSLTYSGSAKGAVWHTGDIYTPDAMLNTASDNETADTTQDGVLTASGSAVSVSSDFTVAVSVRPNVIGGTVLSQSGTNTAGFTLGSTAAGQWQFCLARSDVASPAQDCATGGTVQADVWATLVATYSAKSGYVSLYVDGTQVAGASHTAVGSSLFTGAFLAGAGRTSASGLGGYYSGQVAAIAAWAAVMPPVKPVTAGSVFVPITPTRITDTRSATKIGGTTGPIPANSSFAVNPGSIVSLPSSGVTAVAVTITTTGANGNGVLTVYPDGTPVPLTSNVNFGSAANVTNGVIAALGTTGKFDAYVGGASVQVVIDMTGYFTTNTVAAGSGTYVAIAPERVMDTRNGTGGVPTAKIANGSKDVLAIGGTTVFPSSGVTAVAVNLTVTNATAGANIEAYPNSLTSAPLVTSVTVASGATASAMSIVPVSNDGKVDIYNTTAGGPADVIADVVGYFVGGTSGQLYHPMAPTRLVDTRQSGGPLAVNSENFYEITTISAFSPNIVANVTEVDSGGSSGIITVYPAYEINPSGTSTIDYPGVSTLADFDLINAYDATAPSQGSEGEGFQVTNAGGTPQLIVDVTGYFAGY